MHDTPSGPAHEPVLDADERAAFLRSIDNVRLAVSRQLGALHDVGAVVRLVRNLQGSVDRVVDGAVRRGARVDCKAGCSHCCHARVEALAPEVFRIADVIAQRTPEEIDRVVARLRAHVVATDGQPVSWERRPACPFLVDHLCSVYDVRPATCRKGHSSDVTRCETRAREIPQSLEIAVNAEALITGTSAAYREAGYDGSSKELVPAVLQALLDRTTQRRWYDDAQGESPIAP